MVEADCDRPGFMGLGDDASENCSIPWAGSELGFAGLIARHEELYERVVGGGHGGPVSVEVLAPQTKGPALSMAN